MKNRLPPLLFSAHSMDFYTPRRTRPELHLVEPSRLWVGLQAAREVRDGREQNERKNKIGKNCSKPQWTTGVHSIKFVVTYKRIKGHKSYFTMMHGCRWKDEQWYFTISDKKSSSIVKIQQVPYYRKRKVQICKLRSRINSQIQWTGRRKFFVISSSGNGPNRA